MNMIIKKKQLVSVALVLTLSAAVFVNWYFARPGVKSTIDTGKTTANRQVENYFSSIVTQVRMADGFTPDMEWALIPLVILSETQKLLKIGDLASLSGSSPRDIVIIDGILRELDIIDINNHLEKNGFSDLFSKK